MSREALSRGWKIVVAAAGLVAMTACGGYGSTPSPVPDSGGSGAPADVTITINGMFGAASFSPSTATLRVGQSVAWRNADSTPHTATGSGFDTGAVAPGATSRAFTLTSAGDIPYHCSIHPTMTGTLRVTQ